MSPPLAGAAAPSPAAGAPEAAPITVLLMCCEGEAHLGAPLDSIAAQVGGPLDAIAHARRAPLPRRMAAPRRVGLYHRRTRLGDAALWVAALLGRLWGKRLSR